MLLSRRSTLPLVWLVVASAALVTPPASAGGTPDGTPAATTCLGKPVTIVATDQVTSGTPGDDVVAMTPLGWSQFDALGGNDTICLALGSPIGGKDPLPPTGWLEAGDGDDTVVDEAAAVTGATNVVGLGAGDDTFVGSSLDEKVFADSRVYTSPSPVPSGAQRDVIGTGGGYDEVWTAPGDGLNADRVTSGPGQTTVHYEGAMAPDGVLDLAAADSASLQLPMPGAAAPVAQGELMVDNVSRRATVNGSQVLTWTGNVTSFRFGQDAATSSGYPVSFSGSDAGEAVTIAGGPVGDVRLAGGDDYLDVEAYNDPFVPRSADGGRGADTAQVDTACHSLTVVVESSATCDGATGPFTGFADVIASSNVGGSRVTLTGTDDAESLVAIGDFVRVRGLGGADLIGVDEGWTTRVYGGGGADRIYAQGDDVVVRGQAGADHILLQGTPGYVLYGSTPVATKRQVALGGPGSDFLKGTAQRLPDRLLGGGGRDRAYGRAGKRDYCVAEVTRACERPSSVR